MSKQQQTGSSSGVPRHGRGHSRVIGAPRSVPQDWKGENAVANTASAAEWPQASTSEWGSSILQQQLPPEHSLQPLLQPLLQQQQQAPTSTAGMPGEVATIAAASTSLATVSSTPSSPVPFMGSSCTAPVDVQAKELPLRGSPLLGLAEPQQQPAVAQTLKKHSDWVKVVGVCAFAAMLCYLDRTNISTAIVPMAEQFGWDKQFCGAVLSAFFAGYGATQVLGGQWSDRYGGSAVLAGGLALWSLATALTPMAAAAGAIPLLAARTLLGMGQGVAFPAVHALLAKHVPQKVGAGRMVPSLVLLLQEWLGQQ